MIKRKDKALSAENLGYRLDTIMGNMKLWNDNINQIAKASKFSYAFIRSSCGFDRALNHMNKAMIEMDRANWIGAAYFLDQAELHCTLKNVNEANVSRFIRNVTEGECAVRGHKHGGDKTADIRKREAAERWSNIESEAKKLRKQNPKITNAEIARRLSERNGLGGKKSIENKLGSLLRD